jgi:sugar transferase (PEP-CTERM/EpsH1 system associated)
MKILFLAHRTPYPPDKGDKIRSFHLLSQLAKRHTVSLAYWVDDPKDLNRTTVLSRICRGKVVPVPLNPLQAKGRALWSLVNGYSFSEGYYYASRFQRVVDTLIHDERPDVIYVFSSAMARYVEGIQKTPTIVDFVDVDSDKWQQLSQFARFPLSRIYRLEQARLAKFEIAISRWARYSLFVSEVEADLFRGMGGKGNIVAVPNGVESDFRRLPVREELKPDKRRTVQKSSRSIHILFVGTMNYFPNCDAVLYFAREIFPHIRTILPQVVFDIVGRLPPRSVRRLGSTDGIRVHGEVEEIQPFLAQADVSIAPMRIARGVPNKILEAMAVGVPVVATTEAVKGISVRDGEDVLLGDSPENFAAQVIRLFSDSHLRTQITKRARQRVQEVYNWKKIGNQLDDLIEDIRPTISLGVA